MGKNRKITETERAKVKQCIQVFFEVMETHDISPVVACIAINFMQQEFQRKGIRAFSVEVGGEEA